MNARIAGVIVAVVISLSRLIGARAQDAGAAAAPDAGPPPEAAEPQAPAVDWETAPEPTEASGIARSPESGDGALWIPRVLFFIPKWTFYAVMSPVRLFAWSYERYQLRDRWKQVFFNVDGTFGIYPVAFFETGFGFNVGARLVHKDLFGDHESVRLRAGFGGEFEQVYEAKLSTGERLGSRVSLGFEAHHERRSKDRFFGIGNGDQGEPGTMINPLVDDTSVDSKFRQDITRFVLRGNIGLVGPLSLHPSSALVYRKFDVVDAEDRNIGENYDLDSLPGFETGVSNVYSELELRFDTRDRASKYESRAVDATGWLLAGYAGWQEGFNDDPSSFMRYGADLQRFINLYRGNRVLTLRLMVDAVWRTGGEVEEVPFVDLPRLGGVRYLRGYTTDRFRDRIVTLGTVEYMWDLIPLASAVLFVDAGRPFRVWDEFELDGFRFGFGGGIELHTGSSFLGRFHVAVSDAGDLFFNLSFDPLYARRERAGRL